MKIKTLKIKNYKNLDAELRHDSDLIAFIGNNGSGKSNLLEAISLIFRSWYVPNYKVNFDYSIKYSFEEKLVEIEQSSKKKSFLVDEKEVKDIASYLPKKVVAIYSGEDKRLFRECYQPFYLDFIRNISKGNEYSELPKMLYLNKYYWHIALLCLLVSDSEDNIEFVKKRLKIDSVDSIRFDFSAKNYKNYQDNVALQLVKLIDNKNEYTLQKFKELVVGYIPDEIFKLLYLAFTLESSEIITDISIKFNNGLQIDSFSEGEKKLLLIKAALEFAGQEDTLFILDEPDAHVHIANKELIVNSFENYKENRQIIITTHSPTLTQCVKDENVYMLNNGKIEDKNRQNIIEELTGEFWNKHQQNSFLSSQKPIILLVEGKHDKEHISNAYAKLKDEYPDLNFDIFNMNSANNIPPMMTGLRTNEIDYKKLFIGVFDDDEVGRTELDKTMCKYPHPENKKRHKEGYYAINYPKHTDHKSKNFTVENFFDTLLIEEVYHQSLQSLLGKFKGKSLETINESIAEEAKFLLFAKSRTLTDKENFKNFRLLFNKIEEVYNDWKSNMLSNKVSSSNTILESNIDNNTIKENTVTQPQVSNNLNAQNLPTLAPNTNEVSDFVSSPNIEDRIKSHNQDENRIPYLEFWESFRAFVEEQEVSFKLQKPAQQNFTNITIGKTGYKICASLSHQKKHIIVQLVVNGKDSRQNFLKLQHEHEEDSKKNLSPNISWEQKEGKEQHINMMKTNVEISKKEDWENQFSFLMEWIEKFYHYFKDKI